MNQQCCKYCNVADGQDHKNHCPTKDANPEWAMKEWQRGFDRGYADEFIKYWVLPGYPIPFRNGYRKGKDMVDAEVDAAWESRMSGHYSEEY